MTPSQTRVFVVGSINRDLVFDVPRFPIPGETVLARDVRPSGGGKGANQAVAAASCGARTLLLGCVGRDPDGEALTRELADAGVNVAHVAQVPEATGTAVVAVDPAGENTIMVASGANLACDEAYVTQTLDDLTRHDVVLAQAEIPLSGLRAAIRAAAEAEAMVVVNLAPVVTTQFDLPARSVLIVNEHEARSLCAQTVGNEDLSALATHFGTTLVVTRGAHDIVVAEQPAPPSFHPAIPAGRVVDTTGAGDAFVGAFAAALAHGHALTTAVRWGAAAGSITVEFAGARSGYLNLETVTERARQMGQGAGL